jgi:hypothetical protein
MLPPPVSWACRAACVCACVCVCVCVCVCARARAREREREREREIHSARQFRVEGLGLGRLGFRV